MLPGFNTNYRYRGVLFHVQTEDSGRANPRIFTHLFHGGNILASEKCDYSDKLEAEDVDVEVRGLMEGQHKSMLQKLSRGEYDALISERLGFDALRSGGDTAATLPPEPLPSTPAAESDAVSGPASASAADSRAGSKPVPARAARREESQPAVASAQRAESPAENESAKDRLARLFGDGIVSEKPLDEVVLDYLVENARKRKRPAK